MGGQEWDSELLALDAQLRRLRRCADRQRRRIGSSSAAWQAWSTTIDEALAVVGCIARTPARGLPGLAVKVCATVWFLLDTSDAVLDAEGARQLRALGREVRRLAGR
ncbi:MAG: hypothetical protein Q7T08_02710 [Devosia sp.]|nr:hypothetical protein [Devosia sp.]